MSAEADANLTDIELRQLASLLHRYCAHDLDQWEVWRTATPDGDVFVTLSRTVPDVDPIVIDDLDSRRR